MAHATAEEEKVYPELRRSRAISGHEEEHGEEEHAEIIEALLEFLRAKGTDTQKYDDTLEELATVVNHHSNEEEQTILNPAREDVVPRAPRGARRRLADPPQPAARGGLRERGAGRRQARGGGRRGRARAGGRPRGGRRDRGARRRRRPRRSRRPPRRTDDGQPAARRYRGARDPSPPPCRVPRFLRPGDQRAPRRARAGRGAARRGGRRRAAQPGQGGHLHRRRADRLRRARAGRAGSRRAGARAGLRRAAARRRLPRARRRRRRQGGARARPTSPTSGRWR